MNIRRPGDHSAATSPGQASPPTIRHSSSGSCAGDAPARDAGPTRAWLARNPCSASASTSPASCRDSGSTSAAPAGNDISSSMTAASKLSEATWATRDAGPISKVSMRYADRLARPWWLTTTPLGRPVDPDV
nr:hypothetical protein GCM10017745_42140 [Saccharothrix mutabilis subsp. capreolus]